MTCVAMFRWPGVTLGLLMGIVCGLLGASAQAADAMTPHDYAVRLAITPAPGGAVQRLTLPVQALVALQTADYRDVRIFDAASRIVPMALVPAVTPPAVEQRERVACHPILGAADVSATASSSRLKITLDRRDPQRITEVRVAALDAPQRRNTMAAGAPVVGYLLDTRRLHTTASALALEAEVPPGRLVRLHVAASRDLEHWQDLAQTVVYRAPDAATTSVLPSIALPPTSLKDHALRLTWAALDAGALDAPAIRRVELVTQTHAAPQRLEVRLAAVALKTAHTVELALPFATPIAAVDIVPSSAPVVLPVRLWGRNGTGASAAPWTPLSQSVVYRLSDGANAASGTLRNPSIALPAGSWQQLKIEADARTAGFSAAPEVLIAFDPVQIVFIAEGAAPYTLAVGRSPQKTPLASPYLPLASVMPAYQPGQEAHVPLAVVTTTAAATFAVTATEDRLPTRTFVLWGVLIAGVMALAAMGWALLKRRP